MTEPAATSAASRRKPPIPEPLYRIVNPAIDFVLRSPLHGLMSGALMLITFRGRRSGRRFTTPVGYQQDGATLHALIHRPWWKNMRGGASVMVRLRGQDRVGQAVAIEDPDQILPWLRRRITEIGGIKNARRLGLTELDLTHEPSDDELRHAIRGAALLRIQLEPTSGTSAT